MIRYDVLGEELRLHDRVACAFSYSRAAVGHMRIGQIVEMEDDYMRIRWEDGFFDKNTGNDLSPKMKYGKSSRWLRL